MFRHIPRASLNDAAVPVPSTMLAEPEPAFTPPAEAVEGVLKPRVWGHAIVGRQRRGEEEEGHMKYGCDHAGVSCVLSVS